MLACATPCSHTGDEEPQLPVYTCLNKPRTASTAPVLHAQGVVQRHNIAGTVYAMHKRFVERLLQVVVNEVPRSAALQLLNAKRWS